VSRRLSALGVIPARLASTRLPRKVLREIAGKPLVVHVWEAARRAPDLAEVLVATDSDEVLQACARHGVPAVLTSADHPSGTDRVWEIARSRAAFRERAETQVATLKIRLRPEEVDNPAVNKVVCAADGRALYFSKYPVPYDREGRGVLRYKHVGLYAYTRAALETFHRLSPSPLELAENLEQLRFLEHGIPISVVETDEPTIGVDTEADLRAAEARLASRRS